MNADDKPFDSSSHPAAPDPTAGPGDPSDGTPDRDAARRALDSAEHLASGAAGRGRTWVRVYLTVWAAASIGLLLAVGMGTRTVMIAALGVWAVLVAIGAWYANTRGTMTRGTTRRIGLAAGLWTAVYAGSLAIGLPGQSGHHVFWLVAGALAALPPLAAAWAPWRAQEGQAAR